MPFVPCVNAAVAVIKFDLLGKEMANVLNFQRAGAYIQSDIDTLASVVDQWVGLDYLALISTAVTYTLTEVRGLTSSIDLTASNASSSAAGAIAGTCAPANATNCITLLTGASGRSARGRFYAQPTSENEQTDGHTWGATYGPALVVALQTLATDTAASGWALSVLSKQHNGVKLDPHVTRAVTSVVVRNRAIDSQRNRLPRGH